MKMRRLISKHEFDKNMDDYSQLYCTEPQLKNMGVSEQHVFETFDESPASAFHAAGTNYYMDHLRQHDEHQVANFPPLCSQFPTHHSNNILLSQFSQHNFSIDHSSEKAGSYFDFRDTLQSLVKSHLCSSQCFSSSEKPNKIPCNNMINKPFPHAHNVFLLGENDALVKKQHLSVPSDANHPGLNVCDSSTSRPTPSNKKRIRWTEDLHDQFVKTVDLLGGAEKATPKAILKLMNSNLLTILHVKSHLQKYRTARHMPESLQEKSERSSANGISQLPKEISMQMKEAMRLQLEVERGLHQQLELQQNLQSTIDEELRKLKIMFDQQQQNRQQNRYKKSLLIKTKTLHNSCPRTTNEQVPRMLRF